MARVLFHLLIGCLAVATPLAAQTQITTGVIQGSVMDSTGAVLPGVDVTIVNLETNLSQTPDDRTADGRFVFLQLPPGRYTATFRLSGFGTIVQDNIDLTVGQAVNLDAAPRGRQRHGNRDGQRHAGGRDDARGGRDDAQSRRRSRRRRFSGASSRIC